MKTRMLEPHVASVTVADLVSLFLVLAVASGIALGAVVLVTVWRWLRGRGAGRSGRGMRVPPGGVIGQELGGAR